MAPALSATWKRHHAIAPWKILIRRGLNLLNCLVKARAYRGLSVAVLGPDGAGKTTLIKDIQEAFILPVRPVYMGLTGGLLRYIAYLHVPGLVLLCRLLVFWCRYLRAQYHQTLGRLVLFDRYIYDAMVPHPGRLNWLRRASRWVDGHACPGPDLVLVLNAPGEVMYARKGEYTPEKLEEWRRYYLALQNRISQLEIVDAAREKDVVRIDAIDRIWQRHVVHWTKNSSTCCAVN
jgi:thymidylate kinase